MLHINRVNRIVNMEILTGVLDEAASQHRSGNMISSFVLFDWMQIAMVVLSDYCTASSICIPRSIH